MRVISWKPLRQFAARHSGANPSVSSWFKLMTATKASNLAELRRTFPKVSYVPINKREIYVFNVGGNNYRVVTEINFKRQIAVVLYVLTHAEYDTDRWKTTL